MATTSSGRRSMTTLRCPSCLTSAQSNPRSLGPEPSMPRLTRHARDRMVQRGITEEDIQMALSRKSGEPRVGSNGAVQILGYAAGGRILKVVLTPDQEAVITLAWPDESR
ncbi:MAG: DUF4258 domain-containing protein [Streptosporangiaceae bacterium]